MDKFIYFVLFLYNSLYKSVQRDIMIIIIYLKYIYIYIYNKTIESYILF